MAAEGETDGLRLSSRTWRRAGRTTRRSHSCSTNPLQSASSCMSRAPTDEEVRTIEIWANEQAWQRYGAERLDPVIAALGGPATAQPSFRDLHPGHVVIRDTGTPTTPEGARS